MDLKIQIDVKNKVISLFGDVNLGELMSFMDKINDWDKYTIIVEEDKDNRGV